MTRVRVVAVLVTVLVGLALWPATTHASTPTWRPTTADRFQIVLAATPTAAQRHGSFSVIELDGFETSAAVVASLHQLGKKVVCYMDAGTWENWRPDAKKFPPSVLGSADVGWVGERDRDRESDGEIEREGVFGGTEQNETGPFSIEVI